MAALKESSSKFSAKELEQSLQAIVDVLNAFQTVKNEFTDPYPTWREKREKSILTLNQLADSLDTHKINCNISKAVGTSVGIVGGIAAIAGSTLLIASTGGLAVLPVVAATGGATSALGGFAVAGTVVAEIIIEKNDLKKAKAILENDRIESEELFKWMKRSEELEHAVEKIMNFGIFDKILVGFQRIRDQMNIIRNVTPTSSLPVEIKNFLNELCIPNPQKLKLIELFVAIFQSQECLNLFKTIIALYHEVRLVCHRSFSMVNLVVKGFRLLNASIDTGKAVANLARGAKTLTSVSKTARVPLIALGIFSAVSVAVDVITLLLTSKDIIKGSKSELATKIRHCAVKMQEESNILQKVCDDIFHEDSNLAKYNFNSPKPCYDTEEDKDVLESIKLEFHEKP